MTAHWRVVFTERVMGLEPMISCLGSKGENSRYYCFPIYCYSDAFLRGFLCSAQTASIRFIFRAGERVTWGARKWRAERCR